MMPINKIAAEKHALDCYPRESCGLLVIVQGIETYLPCINMAVGSENFAISPIDYARCEDMGVVIGIVHSHPNQQPTPSQADLVACEESNLPWYIVGINPESGSRWLEVKPSGYIAPLLGRQFTHGVLDCYSLVKDWYRLEQGIILPDFDRKDFWWKTGESLYEDNFRQAGFKIVDKPEYGDGIIMQIQSDVPNHAAVYLGDNIIIHHMYNQLSRRDVYGGYYQKHTRYIVRYVGTKGN